MQKHQQHLDQAAHNIHFHKSICEQFPDLYFDWKITVQFYTALHLIHALASKKGIDIGNTHQDVSANCNPKRKGKMAITEAAWRNYDALWNYSHTARYDGVTDIDTFNILRKHDHFYCLQHLDFIKKYVKGKGLDISTLES